MKHLLLIRVVVVMSALLGACERRVHEPQPHKRPHQMTSQQRFFSGQALPGEFLTLQSLPPIPASFEEPPQ